MKTIDVLEGLLNNDQSMPSMGELIYLPKDLGDHELLYEDTSLDNIASLIDDQEYNAAEQGAFMQFQKMETMVESIADMTAKKRHGCIGGDPGVGKDVRYDTPVLMPDGNKIPIVDLKVGDVVKTPTGTATVIDTIHRGVQPYYEMLLENGMKAYPGAGHLWRCTVNGDDLLVTTKWIMDHKTSEYAIPIYNGTSSHIFSIKPNGEALTVCITLDDKEGLFIIENGIITHNCLHKDTQITIMVDEEIAAALQVQSLD